ncbi:uncharacterized protein LOC124815982 isoform X2 [Hydra vulgaris]|uniref:uncharacterized protein LOC124815982 isoform X2 n=1 Tax=Hydra vulgaris TaxID=6087 RepID=UPI0032EA0A35
MASILHPLTCGFAKIAAYNAFMIKIDRESDEGTQIYTSRKYKYQYNQFQNQFQIGDNNNFVLSYSLFVSKYKQIIKNIRLLGKTYPSIKTGVMQEFSLERWRCLTVKQKTDHRIKDYLGCQNDIKFKYYLSQLPNRCKSYQSIAAKKGLLKHKELMLNDITNTIITQLDKDYQNTFQTTFTKTHSKILKIKNKSTEEMYKQRKHIIKNTVLDIENQWKETSVIRTYGKNISLRTRNNHRLITSMETFKQAEQRSCEFKEKGVKKPKKHIGSSHAYKDQLNSCLEEVKVYKAGEKINYSDLARKYNIIDNESKMPKNGGQIVKEFLKEKDVNLTSLSELKRRSEEKSPVIILRKKRRLTDLNVSFPQEETNAQVAAKLNLLVSENKYSLGELIAPQTFSKLFVRNNEIENETFSIDGREHPLKVIRDSITKNHWIYMRVKTDEEYEKMSRKSIINYLKRINEMQEVDQDEKTNNLKIRLKKFERKRHFMLWHDTSTISNHSHVLMTISTLFDPEIHYTSEEYQQKYNKTINIQAVVEAPIWYIFGRCSATDEMLVYSEQRLNDIIQMKDPIKNSEI